MHARSRARPGCHSEPEGLPPKGAGSAVSGRWSPEERRSVRRLSEGGPRLSRGASLPPTDRDGMFPNGKGNSDGGWMRLPPEQRCQYFKAKPLRKQLRGTQPRAKPRGGRSLSSGVRQGRRTQTRAQRGKTGVFTPEGHARVCGVSPTSSGARKQPAPPTAPVPGSPLLTCTHRKLTPRPRGTGLRRREGVFKELPSVPVLVQTRH